MTHKITKHMFVDGNNLLMRSIYASERAQMSFEGINTGPLTLFIGSLAHLIREEEPDIIGVAWDHPYTWRRRLSALYKENRKASPISDVKESAFPQAKEFLDVAGIDQMQVPGWEADDIIAHWWRTTYEPTPEHQYAIVITSSDKDFLQLVGPSPHGIDTELVRLSSASAPTDRWSANRVRLELGYEPAQWPLITALTGDTSDGVIGLPGIGPKRAQKLLERHDWTLDQAVRAEHPQHVTSTMVNYALVDLRNEHERAREEVPLPMRVHLAEPNRDRQARFDTFLRRYGLEAVRTRWVKGELWRGPPQVLPGRPLRLNRSPLEAAGETG